MNNIISYGISRNYLKHWRLNEAFRELFQNFMDYGEWEVKIKDKKVIISNAFVPENLEFLLVGYSKKDENVTTRGKYGEGLKMALLVLTREGYPAVVKTKTDTIYPLFVESPIGEVFAIDVEPNNQVRNPSFSVEIRMEDTTLFENYYKDIIKEKDIAYDDKYYGKIVRRKVGRLYCGGLFVCEVANITKAYDINPRFLSLDRDRKTPTTFDVNWACSKINESYKRLQVEDLSHSDHLFVSDLSPAIKKQITPKVIGNSIYATYKNKKGKTEVIKNDKIHELVKTDSFFKKVVDKLRKYIASKLGIYELLVQFRDKHIYESKARTEFNAILNLIKEENGRDQDNK